MLAAHHNDLLSYLACEKSHVCLLLLFCLLFCLLFPPPPLSHPPPSTSFPSPPTILSYPPESNTPITHVHRKPHPPSPNKIPAQPGIFAQPVRHLHQALHLHFFHSNVTCNISINTPIASTLSNNHMFNLNSTDSLSLGGPRYANDQSPTQSWQSTP